MYYEEQLTDDGWYCRTSPTGEWHLMTVEQLTAKIARLHALLTDVYVRMDSITDAMREYLEGA